MPTIVTERRETEQDHPTGTLLPAEPGYDGFLAFAERVELDLEPFQRRIARAAHESRELLVLLARGNGKSRLIGTLAVHHLLTTESPAVYVAAASRDQARVVFEYALEVAAALDLDELVVRHLELRVPGGHLRVLASDAPKLHGIHPTLAVIDEMQAFRDGSVYEALRTGLLEDSQLWTISTAGQGATSPLGVLRRRALAGSDVRVRGARKPARIYDLRSTFASNALAAGVSVFELARIMGTSVGMIERSYGTLIEGAGADIARRLGAFEGRSGDEVATGGDR